MEAHRPLALLVNSAVVLDLGQSWALRTSCMLDLHHTPLLNDTGLKQLIEVCRELTEVWFLNLPSCFCRKGDSVVRFIERETDGLFNEVKPFWTWSGDYLEMLTLCTWWGLLFVWQVQVRLYQLYIFSACGVWAPSDCHAAARLISLSRKHEHITPTLLNFHWLPIHYRIVFKILLITYKALNNLNHRTFAIYSHLMFLFVNYVHHLKSFLWFLILIWNHTVQDLLP